MTPRPQLEAGFTLVELLVVLFVIGLLSGSVIYALPDRPAEAEEAADDLALAFRRAGRASISSGELIGWSASSRGYAFSRYRSGQWESIGDTRVVFDQDKQSPPLIMEVLDVAATSSGDLADQTQDDTLERVRLVFSPTGESTAVEVVFIQGQTRQTVSVDESGAVSLSMEGDSA